MPERERKRERERESNLYGFSAWMYYVRSFVTPLVPTKCRVGSTPGGFDRPLCPRERERERERE